MPYEFNIDKSLSREEQYQQFLEQCHEKWATQTEEERLEERREDRKLQAKMLDDYQKSPAGIRYAKSYRNKSAVVLASALLAPFTGGLSLIAGAAAEVVHRSNHNDWK